MNRETKIGLLTGLGVIVTIGVVLSDHLGSGSKTTQPVDVAARWGPDYRADATRAAGVPVIEERTAGGSMVLNNGSGPLAGGGVPVAFAGSRETAGPTMGAPVVPVPAGAIPMPDRPSASSGLSLTPATSGLDPALYVAADPTKPAPTTLPKPPEVAKKIDGIEHMIAKGDTLTVIAKKYYKTASTADRARIILANPNMLKDEKSMLVVGKKLIVPPAPVPVIAKADPVPPTPETKADPRKAESTRTRIGLPGLTERTDTPKPPVATKIEEPKAKTYTVAKGDTIEKIASKYLGSTSRDAIAKIVALNKLKDASSIQVGQVLKMPAKPEPGETTPRARG